jgi:ribulose-phosphate 3-epimerase
MSWREWMRGVEVQPSIYAANFAILGEQLETLLDAGVRIFHYDVGDGHFVEPITTGPIVLESIAPRIRARGGVVDAHLMVTDPAAHFEQLVAAGAASATFHLEAVVDPVATAAQARRLGLGVGLAINPETAVDAAAEAAEAAGADLVLCMSIHPGRSGQAFMPEAYARLAELRRRLPAGVLVQVDGGVGAANVADVHAAGADLLVAGSSIFWQPDLAAAYRGLLAALGPHAATRPTVRTA